MTTMYDCIQSAFDQGAITKPLAQRYQQDWQDLVDRMTGSGMPLHAAQAEASAQLKDVARAGLQTRRHARLNQLATMRANIQRINQGGDPAKSLIHALEAVEGYRDGGESVVGLQRGLQSEIMGMISEFLTAHGKSITGQVRAKAGLMNVVRELHGAKTGDASAAGLADGIRAAYERTRTLANAHGMDIGKLEDFGLPHSHDILRIRQSGFEAWRDQIKPLLDWSRITDHQTGKPFVVAKGARPMDADADRFLRDVYDNITTRDWNRRAPSMAVGGKALYNQRAEARLLHFNDADGWMAYNEAFGSSNPFDAIVSHFQGMARDIALMRVLGPNPKLGLEHMIQVAQKKISTTQNLSAKELAKLENRLQKTAVKARAILGHIDGSANVPADGAWSRFFAGTRQVLTSAQLGSAILSSATDLKTVQMAAKSIGMNSANVLSRQVQLLAGSASRETAARMGYVADTLADAGSASARFLGDVWSPALTQNLSNFVLRASGLSHWTDMTRTAFRMEFSGYLAENAARSFDQIDKPMRDLLEGRGFTAADWDKIRDPAGLFIAPDGSTFISPKHWREAVGLPRAEAEGLSMRLSALIEEQLEIAVPSVRVEARATVIGEAPPGTFYGELLRSTAMYKNFALSLTLNQYRRVMAQPTPMARAQYAASMIAGLTLLGAVSVQLKELAKGRDPISMDRLDFWGAALFQGGGLGIFGDFFSSETSRAGGGVVETIAGPVVGLGGDVLRAVASNAQRVADGKDMLIGRDVTNLARRNTPGTSLWYARTALDRLVWDQMQEFLDPEANAGFRRMAKRQLRNNGNEYWWSPGEATPDRGPDLSSVVTQ